MITGTVGGPRAASYRDAFRWLVRAWDRCWFSRFDPVSIGVFRIFLGALLTLFYVALFPNWERFYAADGILSLNDFPTPAPWSVFSWTEAFLPIRVFWWVGFLASILFMVGWKTRLWTLVLFVLQCSLLNRSPQVENGEDVVFRMLLFYSLFAPLGHRLSLDSLFGPSSPPEEELPVIWAVRAMQINFALIYAISLPFKLADDAAWWTGDALYLAIVSNQWSRWPWPEMFYVADGLLTRLLTYGTLVVEAAFPLLVWFRPTRLYVICAVACLHLGIAVMLNGVSFFSVSMLCGLWIFVPPEVTWKLMRGLGLTR